MAEAVGLAVSLCGLVAVALKVFKLCYNYLSEATNAQGDIVQLGSGIPSLASLLEPPLTPAEANKISQTHSDSISQLVPQCTEMLRQLQVGLQCQLRKQSDSRTRNLAVSSKTSLKWPFKKEESQNRIQKIKRLKATVTLKLQLDEKQRRKDRKQRENVERILEWISSERFGKRHAELQSKRKQGIGNWLLATPEFAKWKTKDTSVLLGCGIAGAGKTYLSSVVIEHFNELQDLNGFGVGHIYFEYQEQQQQNRLAIEASLVKQLLSQIPPTAFLKDIETKYQKKPQHASADDLTNVLLSIPKRFAHRVLVVCDALDEVDQHEQRDHLLSLFYRMENSGIALFLTTRPHTADIQESFRNASIMVPAVLNLEVVKPFLQPIKHCHSTE